MTEPRAGRKREPGESGESGKANGGLSAGAGVPGYGGASPRSLERYLVAARSAVAPPPGGAPLPGPTARLTEMLEAHPGVRVISRIGDSPDELRQWPPPQCPTVLVVEAPPAVAAQWMRSPQLVVEPDVPLAYVHPNPIASAFAAADPAVLVAPADEQITIVVRGVDDEPVSGAAVYMTGGGWPVSGSTDKNGRVTLRVASEGAITGMWIRPRAGFWPIVVDRPHLSTEGENVVVAQPLDATFEGFPKRKVIGWASQALRSHEIAPTFRGHGVKIALIDSGAASAHPELDNRLAAGVDLLTGNDKTWAVDTLGHGTACAGIITAADNDQGIDGLAVDSEVQVLKLMPGGRLSHLLQALDHCVRKQIDVAQISVGTLRASELVALKIADVVNAGVLCVAPAGNTDAGPVTFPASLPMVLSVGAVGLVGTFPAESRHPADIGPVGQDGLFVPRFTASGHEVDVCAPGVAVVSTVAPDGYAVLDGTGVAAAHITALAALVLAHHDDFRARYARGPARVDRLRQLIMSSSRPVSTPGTRTGVGIPDARVALAAGEPVYPDWANAVLSQLQVDLTRAGLIPTGAAWPARGTTLANQPARGPGS